MPELPEVETIVRGLRRHIIGPTVKKACLHFSAIVEPRRCCFTKLLNGDQFTNISRHGKYIKLTTRQGTKILIHLRMTGQLFTTHKDYEHDKHTHLTLTFNNDKSLVYRDVRKFGRWTIIPPHKDFHDFINAGTDALSLSKKELIQLMHRHRNMKLKAFLLNQTILAGIGNIYADEICYTLKLHPESPISSVDPQLLYKNIHKILNLAIKHNGTTVSDYRTSRRRKGNFQNLLKVYQQDKCPRCRGIIAKRKVAGRSSHFCPKCQKRLKGQ
jgi:formamidopyrimidine-DNA glycosylase